MGFWKRKKVTEYKNIIEFADWDNVSKNASNYENAQKENDKSSFAKSEAIIWKYERIENGKTVTQFKGATKLIVPFGCEAIYLKDGALENIYQPGGHVLEDIESVSSAQFYYINKSVTIQSYWGTPSKIEFREAETNIPVSMGASGSYKISVLESGTLFARLVGAHRQLTTEDIKEFFKSEISSIVRDILVRIMVKGKVKFFDLVSDLLILSQGIRDELVDILKQYGIALGGFTVDNVMFPTEIKEMIAKHDRKSYEYQKEKAFREEQRDEKEEIKREMLEDKKRQKEEEWEERRRLREEELENRQQDREDVKIVGDAVTNIEKASNHTIIVETGKNGNFCTSCGELNANESRYCNKCGRELFRREGSTCTCGARLVPGSKFCNSCGKKVD